MRITSNPRTPIPSIDLKDELLLKFFVTYWQNLLKLNDWEITVLVVDPETLGENTWGDCSPDNKRKRALIRVLDPDLDLHANCQCHSLRYNMAATLLHEILHIPLSTLHVTSERSDEEEFLINSMSAALLELASGIFTQDEPGESNPELAVCGVSTAGR